LKKKFTALVGKEETEFFIEKTGESSAVLSLDGKDYALDIVHVGERNYSLLYQGHSYTIGFVTQGDKLQASWQGETAILKLIDEKKMRRKGGAGMADVAESGNVVSPMPGRVVKVHVTPGQKVTAGDGIVVVEAMKMENEFKSPKDGVVKDVCVKVGDSVEGGVILAVVE
jgi:biotin carboxyl carrier protein